MKGGILVFTLCALASCIVSAQAPFFQHYALFQKKIPINVNAIFQDRDGFLWIGTPRGLFKFDGKNQIRFTEQDSLANINVTAIAQDSLGRIWTGHSNGKISYFDNGKILKFEPEEGTSSEHISDIIFDRKGNLWFSTYNDGLYYFAQNRLHRLDEKEGMPDLYIYDIVEDGVGNIFAATDGGIAICSLNNGKLSIKVLNHKNGLPDNIIKKIVLEKNELWLASEDFGIFKYDLATGKHTPLLENWRYGPISDFLIKDDHFWIACPQKGLVVFDTKTSQLQVFNNQTSPGVSSLNVLLKDIEGSIWAGSKNGLMRTPGNALTFINNFGPSDENILSVTVDKQNNLWYSNKDGLFKRTTDEMGRIINTKPLSQTPYSKYTVISLFTDSAGFVWSGLYGEGVLRIDPRTNEVHYFQTEIRNGNVLSITGKGSVVWLATLGGSSKITVKNDNFTVENFSRDEGLSSDFIYQVFSDSKNRVWFATDGKGVDMMDELGFHHIDKGLPSGIVYGITEDGKGKIWANVQGNGAYIFDGKASFEKVSSSVIIRDKEIHAMATDRNGNVVLLHDLGLDIVDISKNNTRHFGGEAGVQDKITNLNASGKDQFGNLYFGTSSGIIKYAGSDSYLQRAPQARIISVRVLDHITNMDKISNLNYDENNLTFNFLGLWYQSPDDLFFSYKLENYDNAWITTKNNAVTYSRLPPGQYTFKVKVSLSENFPEAHETTLNVLIHPPFWQTNASYMMSLVASIVCVYSFIKYRERKLLHDKFILETRVRERTIEVQQQNGEIQAQNEEIMAQAEEIKGINENLELIVAERTTELERKNKALEEYAFINAHKLRSPVASILGLINLSAKLPHDEDGKEINKRLQKSAQELDDIVRSITKAIEKGEKQYPFH